MFRRFQSKCPLFVQDKIADGMTDDETAAIFSNHKEMADEAVGFATTCLQTENQPCDDYRELLELTIMYMGCLAP